MITGNYRIPFSIYCVSCGLCLLSLLTLACGLGDQTKDNVVIIVGSSHITTDQLKTDMEFISAGIEMPTPYSEKIRDQIIDQCINHYLIVEYGKVNDITISENELENAVKKVRKEYTDTTFDEALLRGYVDFEVWKKRLKEQLLVDKIIKKVTDRVAAPKYEDIKQYFETHQNEFESSKMIEFRQIVTVKREDAENLLKRLHNGEKMSALARKYSVAPEAESGGKVGWVAKGHLNESMEKVLFSMPKGKISKVTETPYGYHIFEVLSIRPAGIKKLSEVIKELETKLLFEKRETFLNKWIQDLKNTFEVRVNRNMLKTLELS